jgi:hypothetical protein
MRLSVGQDKQMQMVRFKFAEEAREAEGMVALAKRVRVICFADDTYEIAKPSLRILDDLGIAYRVLVEEGFDGACHALRNSDSAKV